MPVILDFVALVILVKKFVFAVGQVDDTPRAIAEATSVNAILSIAISEA